MREMVVAAVTRPVAGVRRFVLAAADGRPLPAIAPGDHIEVETPCGLLRPYSLCGDPAQRETYEIAVLREVQGRGGSRAMHDALAKGRRLRISEPRSLFPLRSGASFYRLIAGGIGATPLVAMAHHLVREKQRFDFHYCARNRESLVFWPELERLVPHGALHVHLSTGEDARRFVPRADPPPEGCAVYCCGPLSLMEAVHTAYSGLYPVHSESFKPQVPDDATAFEVVLARSGRTVPVKADESILVALWRAGIERPLSCETGICGTCRTPWCGGEPEHRDSVLSAEERQREMLICVSRCRSKTLVLDI
ncbi:MAG TPA: PDR/VanB family oxidoreductase [Beijerinckiaceae bacterium]|jgi:vanillate O-demethylase ferredoxin subunit|nr:PDR/VanB family oxidoreductase [Beijerinckiaceae bacterium]